MNVTSIILCAIAVALAAIALRAQNPRRRMYALAAAILAEAPGLVLGVEAGNAWVTGAFAVSIAGFAGAAGMQSLRILHRRGALHG